MLLSKGQVYKKYKTNGLTYYVVILSVGYNNCEYLIFEFGDDEFYFAKEERPIEKLKNKLEGFYTLTSIDELAKNVNAKFCEIGSELEKFTYEIIVRQMCDLMC